MKGLRVNATRSMLAILILAFTAVNPNFLSAFNLYNFWMQNEYRIVMIIGLSFIVLGGEIDLSLGYQISLVGVLMGKMFSLGVPTYICLASGLLTGILCGLLNGSLVAVVGIPSFIVTLITQKLFQGLSYLISGGMMYSDIPDSILGISSLNNGMFTSSHIVVIISLLIFGGIFSSTVAGKNILAMGYDERVLAQNGIGVKRYKCMIYVIGSILFFLASLILLSRQGLAVSNMGVGMELDGLFAVCIAGGGGLLIKNSDIKRRVPLSNFFVAILIVGVIENGLQLIGISQYYQYIVLSVLVLYFILIAMLYPLNKNTRKI